jgi:folate-dependent phosphoribosylglycinamide formyltransferase PurN
MKNIVFLVSGGGANLKFVQYSIKLLKLNCRISGVIADRDILFENFLKEEVIVKNENGNYELNSKYKIVVKDRFEYSEIDIIFEQNTELNREFLLKEILNND